jgi:hypothetical protein
MHVPYGTLQAVRERRRRYEEECRKALAEGREIPPHPYNTPFHKQLLGWFSVLFGIGAAMVILDHVFRVTLRSPGRRSAGEDTLIWTSHDVRPGSSLSRS